MTTERLSQKFTTQAHYIRELERMSKRWTRTPVADGAYDVDPKDLPHGFDRRGGVR